MRRMLPVLLVLLVLATGCLASKSPGGENVKDTLEVGSVFHSNGYIPEEFTCDGDDVNPPIFIGHIDPAVKSLAIVVYDPDAPGGTFIHWVAWNIPPLGEIPKGVPKEGEVDAPVSMVQGRNDFGRIGYGGPCPPRGSVHHYHFKVYGLDTTLNLKPGATVKDLERAMEGHIVQTGELVGLYKRK